MAKTKKKGVMYWKKHTWDQFSKYIRIRDALRTTGTIEKAVCVSCGRIYPTFGLGCLQAGHFVPGRRNGILFCELGCHAQCYNCNVNLKGNWPGYYEFMVKNYGQKAIDLLLEMNMPAVKFLPCELEELRDLYKEVFNKMWTERTLLKGEMYEDYRANLDSFRTPGDRLLWLWRGAENSGE